MEEIEKWIEENRGKFTGISDRIWEYAEPGLFEKSSSALHASVLSEAGFKVTTGAAGLPTAIVAECGSGKPVIGLLGEFDALPGLSQAAEPFKKALGEGAFGHGCGHNLFGAACLAAALFIGEKIQRGELSGTLRYYGCPAEENANGKAWMTGAGLFDDLCVALTWHPADINAVISQNFQAIVDVTFRFRGRSSHAAADPFNGRSALDAVELMNVGTNYLREHIIPGASLHYIITDGGKAPNIVPDTAESWYFVRAPKAGQAREIYERVVKVAKGAAMMTETETDALLLGGASNLLPNIPLENLLHRHMKKAGAPQFTDGDCTFADKIAKTFSGDFFDAALSAMPEPVHDFMERFRGKTFCDEILPIYGRGSTMGGSTDVGDVSQVVPLAQFCMTCMAFGTPGHSWQLVAQAGMGIGHRGMLQAAKVLSASAAELMETPALVAAAKREFEARRGPSPHTPLARGDLARVFEFFGKLYGV